MTNQHPSTPPDNLVASLRNSAPHHSLLDSGVARELWLINHAYAAGWNQRDAATEAELQERADQELEACCEWLRPEDILEPAIDALRAARRPKPPSLKERIAAAIIDGDDRTALCLLNEALPND
jgi:hypothetical protein